MPTTRVRPYKSLRLRQLRAFCACVRHQSFSAAARALGASQPAVWEQVRALERTFGVTLLLRRGRVLVATEDGEAFLDLAAGLVAGMDSLEERFAERRDAVVRRLVVAGATSLMIEDLSAIAATFARDRADVSLRILTEQNARVLELVANGEADVGVIRSGLGERLTPLVVTEPLHDRPRVLFAPTGHPLLVKRRLTLADLVEHPLILEAADRPWRQLVDEQFRRAGLLDRVRVAAEVNNVLVARRLVSLRLGVTILPQSAHELPFRGVATCPLDGLFPPERVVLIWRKGATPKPSAREFADLARALLVRPKPPSGKTRSIS